MKKLIHTYLSDYYFVDRIRVCTIVRESIFLNGRECKVVESLNSDSIISELTKIFGLQKKQIKWIFKSWIRKYNKGFPFERFWNTPPPPNIGYGINSLTVNTTGCNSVAIGQSALGNYVIGTNNILLGNVTGCNSVAIGYNALNRVEGINLVD